MNALRRKHAKLALEIAKAALRVFLPDVSDRLDSLNDLAKIVFTRDERWNERKSFVRQLQDTADTITARLGEFELREFPAIPETERAIAITAVTTVVTSKALTRNIIITELLLDSERVYAFLEPAAAALWLDERLSEVATEYGRLLLSETSHYLVGIVRGLPEFHSVVSWQTYVLSHQLAKDLKASLDRVVMPRYRPGEPHEVSRFEAAYSEDVVKTFHAMELFGIDVPDELRQQKFDIAYITLSAAPGQFANLLGTQDKESTTLSDSVNELLHETVMQWRRLPVDLLLGNVLRLTEILARTESTTQQKRDSVEAAVRAFYWEAARRATGTPADALALRPPNREGARASRILIVGGAGSGKTTIVHWLALQLASRTLPVALAKLNGSLPFYVPLRRAFPRGGPNPTDETLVSTFSFHRLSSMPGDWIGNRLSSGRALVVFDGLDELSPHHRTIALSWIDKLMDDNPQSHFVITSRPEGLVQGWFTEHAFVRLELQPMDTTEILQCTASWFGALLSSCPLDRVEDYLGRQRELTTELETNRSIRDLAATPLLCAMLCALYAYHRSATAPKTRSELYGSVVDALVHKRDEERERDQDSRIRFDLREKLQLLEVIARYMVESQQTTIKLRPEPGDLSSYPMAGRVSSALELVEQCLRQMPTAQILPEDAIKILKSRSTVFQDVGENEGQYAHRSLQEYLAGCEYAHSSALNRLAPQIFKPEWRRIIVFAAAKATRNDASELISQILNAADRERDPRELLLLAAECISATRAVTEELAERAKHAIARLLPPRNKTEAMAASVLGEDVLPWLAGLDGQSPEIVEASIHTAGQLGSASALAVLADFSARYSGLVSDQVFLDQWERFNELQYAQRVLTNLALAEEATLTSSKQVAAAAKIGRFTKVRVELGPHLSDFDELSRMETLQTLNIPNAGSLTDLAGIGRLGNLRKLNIGDATGLADIEDIADVETLEELYLSRCKKLGDLSAIAELTNLTTLYINTATEATGFDWLSALRSLRTLSLKGCWLPDLAFCRELTQLRRLVANLKTLRPADVDLARCGSLRTLELRVAETLQPVRWELPGTSLRILSLHGHVSKSEVAAAASCSGLLELTLSNLLGVPDTDALSSLTSLRELRLLDCEDLTDATSLGDLRQLTTLEIRGAGIEDLDFLRDSTRLTFLNLDYCRKLRDVSALAALPNLRFVSLVGGLDRIDAAELQRIADRTGFGFSFDPFSYENIETG